MKSISDTYIRETLADSPLIYERGRQTFENGSYFLSRKNLESRTFVYEFNGAFGNYTTRIQVRDGGICASCSCPYPAEGCRHVVAAALNAKALTSQAQVQKELFPGTAQPFLNRDEIQKQALEERRDRARSERFTLVRGDMFTGDHKVVSKESRTYTVCLHDPVKGLGHCSCPDYLTNGLGTCKHILYITGILKKEPGFKTRAAAEVLPFIDIYWDSLSQTPCLHAQTAWPDDLAKVLGKYFDRDGGFTASDLSLVMGLMLRLHGDRRVRVRENLLKRVDHRLQVLQLEKMKGRPLPRPALTRPLYPFQEAAVDFGVLKPGVLIGDEMGLGKTVQAIAMSLVKKEVFGFSKILVITLSSLKAHWKQEIETVSRETACVIQGTPAQRKTLYKGDALFKISHYETVLRDITTIAGFSPDIIILDEAQRIRNLSTKTAEAVKRLPKKHAIVLTGTPLENKPEDLYSVVQFLDPYRFTPLWQFAADHFLIPRDKKAGTAGVAGYKNLDRLRERLSDILIRRTWEGTVDALPDTVMNTYYIDLAPEQAQRHAAYAGRLAGLAGKRLFTPMDLQQIQTLILRMRMVANSTFLVDRETQVSPKIRELSTIIDEIAVQTGRKMVIFSEWTAMTFLIARHLSEAGIGFIESSGKLDLKKRRALAKEFSRDPDRPVFLTTDAGSAGLDLSCAPCLVNVELPATPARMAQRRARLNRPVPGDTAEGPETPCHIINLIGANSIEARIHHSLDTAGQDKSAPTYARLFDPESDAGELSETAQQALARDLATLLGPDLVEINEPRDIPEEDPYLLFPEGMPGPAEPSRPEASQGRLPDPEKLEAVLNAGFAFMAGLVEMAAGETAVPLLDKKISVDPETGEVNLRFKLPY